MYVLGISAFYHDSAACLLKDGSIIAAAQEERFTRIKHDASFPINAISWVLEEEGISLGQVDYLVFYDKPLLKFERILEGFLMNVPRGLASFIYAMPKWLNEKLFLKYRIRKELKLLDAQSEKIKIHFTEHHIAHAASAYFCSGFESSAIVTIDGVGEWATVSIAEAKGNRIRIVKELHYPHSVGLLYSSFTYYLGFRINSGEYKLMGLAPYGRPQAEITKNFINKIKDTLVDIREDGSIFLNPSYFAYTHSMRMIRQDAWQRLFGMYVKQEDEVIRQEHCDLAYAIQAVTEEIVLNIVRHASQIVDSKNLCLAGGVALNCVANGKILLDKAFEEVFIQPAAGDAGGALGAALALHHIFLDKPINPSQQEHCYFGPDFHKRDIDRMIHATGAYAERIDDFESLCDETARRIADGQVVGWFQERMEFGPRALGNRSILADPRRVDMKKTLNLKIKFRESFRPFAPAVLEEDVNSWFDHVEYSPFMLLVDQIAGKHRNSENHDSGDLDVEEKNYKIRSVLPAVTHFDYSCRIQTVNRKQNERFWTLIQSFKNLSGVGILVNTSFNVRGEPIVCTPEQAWHCFMNTEMDFLVIGNYIFDKALQNTEAADGSYFENLRPD